MLIIRRIKMDDYPNRGDVQWVLFEQGDFAHPIRIISDMELDSLEAQIEDQKEDR